MLFQLTLDKPLDVAAVVVGQPAEVLEDFGQRRALARGPRGAGLGELPVVDQLDLQGEDAEEEVAVGA